MSGGGPRSTAGFGPPEVEAAQRQSRRQIAIFLLVVALIVALGVVLGALQGGPQRIGDPSPVATGVAPAGDEGAP